jgi:hypothetical protein
MMEKPETGREQGKNNAGEHTQISIRLPNALLARVATFAAAARRSRSNAIEHLLWQTVKENL